MIDHTRKLSIGVNPRAADESFVAVGRFGKPGCVEIPSVTIALEEFHWVLRTGHGIRQVRYLTDSAGESVKREMVKGRRQHAGTHTAV